MSRRSRCLIWLAAAFMFTLAAGVQKSSYEVFQMRALSADPGTPVDGEVWYNSTSVRIRQRVGGVTYSLPLSPVAIADGGTGQTTATAAFDALDPLTTKGDLVANDGTNSVRLAPGSNGLVLTADSVAAPGVKWAAVGGVDVAGFQAGTCTFVTNITCAVTLPVTEADASYLIVLGCDANKTFWWSAKGVSGFTLNASSSSSDHCDWILIR